MFAETDAGFNPTLSKVQLFEFSLVLLMSCCFLVFCVMSICCMNCRILGLGRVWGRLSPQGQDSRVVILLILACFLSHWVSSLYRGLTV